MNADGCHVREIGYMECLIFQKVMLDADSDSNSDNFFFMQFSLICPPPPRGKNHKENP